MLSAVVLALVVSQADPLGLGLKGPVFSSPSSSRRSATAVFHLLPTSGAGAPVLNPDLCAVASSELTGAYFCLKNDGTSVSSAGLALTANGSPPSVTRRTCNNGLDCANVTGRSLNGTSQSWQTATTVPHALAFTACWYGIVYKHPLGYAARLVSRDSAAASGRGWDLSTNTANGAVSFSVFDTDGTLTTLSAPAGSMTYGAPHLVCARYNGTANNTSAGSVWVDGVQVASSATMKLLQSVAGATRIMVGQRQYVGAEDRAIGLAYGAAYVDHLVSDAAMLSTARAALGTMTGSNGEAVSFTRSTLRSCVAPDGASVTWLPPGRPCVTDGLGVSVDPASTLYITRTDELENYAAGGWGHYGSGVTLNGTNSVVAPDGSSTAEDYTFSATSGGGASALRHGTGGTTAMRSLSVWIRGISAGGTTDLCSYYNGVGYCTACAFTTTWSRCKLENLTGSSGMWLVGNSSEHNGAVARAAVRVALWGAQGESSLVATNYAPGATAQYGTVVRTSDRVPVATTGWPTSAGAISLRYKPNRSAPSSWFLFDTRPGGLVTWMPGASLEAIGGGKTATSATLTWSPATTYSVCAAWDAASLVVQRDGVQVATVAAPTVPITHAATAYVGGYNVSATLEAAGTVGDFRVSSSKVCP